MNRTPIASWEAMAKKSPNYRTPMVAMLPLLWAAAGLPVRSMAAALPTVDHIPLVSGLQIVSVLHSPTGERDNLVTAEQVTPAGVNYRWRAVQYDKNGKREQESFSRFVHTSDLAKATRLHTVYWSRDNTDYRGYTAWSISTAVYEQLRSSGEASFMVVDKLDGGGLGGPLSAAMRTTQKLKGTMRVVAAAPASFPLLLNEQRVNVPALSVRGSFSGDGATRELQFWVLADREHPLILKSINGPDVLQIVRIDTPGRTRMMEEELGRNCRAELPGVYFEFATAELKPESEPTIAEVAAVLGKHPGWTFRIEGHTDNVGPDASNLTLSEARAKAMRQRLIERYGIAAQRLTATGFGEKKPIESNDTIEGRARNRRVELVGQCDK